MTVILTGVSNVWSRAWSPSRSPLEVSRHPAYRREGLRKGAASRQGQGTRVSITRRNLPGWVSRASGCRP